ncbi:MAG: carboxypeptidase regulatory-like domain-containing protein [Acidobacteriota bacterium]
MHRSGTRVLFGSVAIFLFVLLLGGTGLLAQDSSLSGTVTDPQGAVVPGAEVTITNSATGAQRTVLTGDAGRYLIPQVAPGTYEVRAELPGFKTAVVTGVALQVDIRSKLDLQLDLGDISEIVTVTSESTAVLNTLDATLGNAFNEKQIVDLPLNSRNVVNLLTLQPGVTAQGEVSGSRRDQSNLTLDGIDVNDQQQAGSQPGLDAAVEGSPREFQPVLRVTPDSVQEFRVTVANPSASQGRSSGGQVSLITKAGTNNWHGSLYEFHRNTVTTANTFFNNRVGIDRPVLIRNLFGGSLGGPIVKDRAFFFFNYEGRRDRSQTSVIRTVPLPHLGNGEVRFQSESTGQMITLTPDDILALYPATGGINPASVAVLGAAASKYPANDNGAGDQINTDGFRFNAPTPLNQNTYIAKLDFNLSDSQTLFVRGNYQWDTQGTAPQFPDTPAPTIWSHPTGLAIGHTWTATPTITNTFRYGITRQSFSRQGDTNRNFIRFRAVFSPVLNQTTLNRVTPMHNFTNDTSWVMGSHTFQFGTNIRFIDNQRSSFANAFDDATSNAFFYPPGSLTSNVPDLSGGSETSYEHAIAAVLGRFPQYTASFTFGADGSLLPSGSASARVFSTEEYDFYFEDSWQVTPGLTLNYGLRWGINTPVDESTGFSVAPIENLGLFLERRLASAASGIPLNDPIEIDTAGDFYGKKGLYSTDKNNFMPRISAAWTPHFESGVLKAIFGGEGQSVFRGGFAMIYDRVGSQLAVSFDRQNSLGFNSATTISANTYNVTDNLAPLFTGFGQDIRSLPGITTPDRLTFPLSKPLDGARRIEAALDSNLVTPVNYAWNFSIGRELPGGLFVEASYVGRKANDLYATHDVVHPNNIVDPVSGQSFYEAAKILQDARQANVPITSIAPIPFIENMFPNVSSSGAWFIDPSLTPTQNALFWAARSDVGGLDLLDWTFFQDQWNNLGTQPFMFFHPQYAAFLAFGSIAESTYHAFTLTARERFSNSVSIDFNYTLSKSFDTASGLQSSNLIGSAALIRNPLNPEFERGVSDFDTQHIINMNWLWDFPLGRGHRFGSAMPGALEAILGGWSMNGVFRWNSGRPIGGPFESGRWNTNWQISNNTIRTRDPRALPHKSGDQPNFWSDSQFAYNSFRDTYAGEVGDRNVFRRPSFVTLDFGLHKAFSMPYNENHKLVFRWEVFNATNTQKLGAPSVNGVGVDPQISTQRPNFGIITATQGVPRIMQFGLRLEF